MKRVIVMTLSLFVLSQVSAIGAPLDNPRIGGYGVNNPVEPSITGVYYNPAAVGKINGTSFLISGGFSMNSLIYDRGKKPGCDVDASEPCTPLKLDVDPASGSSMYHYTNTFAGLSSDFGTDIVTMGLAVYFPYAQNLNFSDSNPGAQHIIKMEHNVMALTPSLTFNLPERISLGIAVSYYRATIREMYYKESLAYLFRYHGEATEYTTPNIEPEIDNINADLLLANMEQNTIGGYTFGFYYTPIYELSLALAFTYEGNLAYQGDVQMKTPTFEYIPGGETASLDGEASNNYNLTSARATYNGVATLAYNLPMRARFGLRYAPVLEAQIDFMFEWANWSRHDKMEIAYSNLKGGSVNSRNQYLERDFNYDANGDTVAYEPKGKIYRYRGWQDSFKVGLGAAYVDEELIRVGGNILFETSAVPTEAVNLSQVDGSKLDFMLVLEISPTDDFWITFGGGVSFVPGVVGVSDSVYSSWADPTSGKTFSPATGNYTMGMGYGGGLGLRYAFFNEEELTR